MNKTSLLTVLGAGLIALNANATPVNNEFSQRIEGIYDTLETQCTRRSCYRSGEWEEGNWSSDILIQKKLGAFSSENDYHTTFFEVNRSGEKPLEVQIHDPKSDGFNEGDRLSISYSLDTGERVRLDLFNDGENDRSLRFFAHDPNRMETVDYSIDPNDLVIGKRRANRAFDEFIDTVSILYDNAVTEIHEDGIPDMDYELLEERLAPLEAYVQEISETRKGNLGGLRRLGRQFSKIAKEYTSGD